MPSLTNISLLMNGTNNNNNNSNNTADCSNYGNCSQGANEEQELFLSGWPHFHSYGAVYWSIDMFVVFIGIVGNLLQFLLMTDRKISCLSYSVYLKFLSVSDSLVLVFVLMEATEEGFELRPAANFGSGLCKLLNSCNFATKILSPWLVVGLTLDRYVCVSSPLRRERFCTRKKATVVCSSLALLAAALIVPVLLRLEVLSGECNGPNDIQYYLIFVRLLISSTVPCLFILVLNIFIIVCIQRSERFRSSFARNAAGSANQKEDNSTRPLVLISVLAFVTLMPVAVAECTDAVLKLTRYDLRAQELGEKLWPVWNILYRLSFAQNFYILIASASNYRDIIARKLSCCCCCCCCCSCCCCRRQSQRRNWLGSSPTSLTIGEVTSSDVSLSTMSTTGVYTQSVSIVSMDTTH